MSEHNTDHHPASPGVSQVTYIPQYRAEPQQQVLHYPGIHYQLYPAAAATGMHWQPPTRSGRKHTKMLAVWALLLLGVLLLGFRLLDLNFMAGDHNEQRTSERELELADGWVDSDAPADDLARVRSLPPAPYPAAAVPSGSEGSNVPEAPGAAVAKAPPKASEAGETSSSAAVPTVSAAPNNAERRMSADSVALNIPDIRTAVAAPATVAGGSPPAQKVTAVVAVPATRKPAAAATCSDALRAMQLCGEQAEAGR